MWQVATKASTILELSVQDFLTVAQGSRGEGNRILHRDVACGGCGLETCVVERKRCITAIGVGEAVAACRDILSARTHAA